MAVAGLRRRLQIVGTVLLVLLVMLMVTSHVQFKQHRQSQAEVSDVLEIAYRQSALLERIARDLLVIGVSTDQTVIAGSRFVTGNAEFAARLSLRADLRSFEQNFIRLDQDMMRRTPDILELQPVLRVVIEEFASALKGYLQDELSESEMIERLLGLKEGLAPLQSQISARYQEFALEQTLRRQRQELLGRLAFALLVVLLVGLALVPALREVRMHLAEAAVLRRTLGNVVTATNVGTWEWDTRTGSIIVNDRWLGMLGHTHESFGEVTPERWLAMTHPEDRSLVDRELSCMIDQPGQVHEVEFRLRHRDGHWVWIRGIGNSLAVDEQGRAVLLAGLHLDDSRSKQLQQELAKASATAEAANRAKSQFLANMSHEIRTPMTAILGYLEIVHERLAEQGDRHNIEALATVRRNADHLLALINDILDLSKIEAERMEISADSLCLPALLEEMRAVMGARAKARGVALEVQLATPVPERILSDPTRLRQVLFNIVGNALKFTDRGGVQVTVECRCDVHDESARLRIVVSDTGPGIPAAQAARLFQPFSQVDGSMTRSHGGTGLGLAISRRLARLLGGDVTLEWSEPGQGSRFAIEVRCSMVGEQRVASLQAWRDELVQSRAEPRRGARPELKARILLAEDGRDNQRLIAFHLRRAGARVDIADNGRAALEMLEATRQAGQEPYQLLLTDIQMPELDGYGLVAEARRRGFDLPIVALTAHAMVEDRQRCLDAGCNAYATKPIHRDELIETCARWLDHHPRRAVGEPPSAA